MNQTCLIRHKGDQKTRTASGGTQMMDIRSRQEDGWQGRLEERTSMRRVGGRSRWRVGHGLVTIADGRYCWWRIGEQSTVASMDGEFAVVY